MRCLAYGVSLVLLFALACQIVAMLYLVGYATLYVALAAIGLATHWGVFWQSLHHCGELCPR
jgi:hypothetical protein